MYQRRAIRDQDRSTSNGTVHARYNGCSINDSSLAFEGDPVYCPVCKTMGTTKCVMPYRPYTGWDGRQLNLDGDLCLCQCPVPPRLIGLNDAMVMNFEAYEIAQMPGAIPWMNYMGFTLPSVEWIKFQANTDIYYAGVECLATMDDGSKLHGQFDDTNTATFLYVSGKQCVKLQIGNASAETEKSQSITSALLKKITG